ncbi:MAG: hypothetical protein FWE72_09570 [Spirochaetaceae bacterium]|nr:hypothetical protein [Spirochaetaceae bacterium]
MFSYYFNIGLIYILIGFGTALILYYVYNKAFIGNFLGVLVVSIIGSFLGAIIEYYFGNIIEALTKVNGVVNIFPSLIVSILIIYIYHKVSEKK